jgi:hypothetical protein
MDWKLKVVVVPVSDVDRAKRFYSEQVGFVVDLDHRVSDAVRIVQMTPPGSACSITVGTGLPHAPRRARSRGSSWWSPTSRPRAPTSSNGA